MTPPAQLYRRGMTTVLASWEEYARGATGAEVRRLPGVAAAIFPNEPERGVYNNAPRAVAAPARRRSTRWRPRTRRGVERFAAWVHETDELHAGRSAAGATPSTRRRARWACRSTTSRPRAGRGCPRAGTTYLRIFGLPAGLLGGADPSVFHVCSPASPARVSPTAIAFDHDGDCGIFNVATLEPRGGAGSPRR